MALIRRASMKGTAHLKSNAIIALCTAALGFAAPDRAAGQDIDDLGRRLAFDFEQCANACQIEFDESLFSCGEYRNPADGVQSADCRPRLDENFKTCLQACPVDPRRGQE